MVSNRSADEVSVLRIVFRGFLLLFLVLAVLSGAVAVILIARGEQADAAGQLGFVAIGSLVWAGGIWLGLRASRRS